MANYSAIVLDSESSMKLRTWFYKNYGVAYQDWEYIGHHSTINLGSLPDYLKYLIGSKVKLTVTKVGANQKALAVSVTGNTHSINKVPHITVAVNRIKGGKPKDSNEITNWKTVVPFELTGVVTEV